MTTQLRSFFFYVLRSDAIGPNRSTLKAATCLASEVWLASELADEVWLCNVRNVDLMPVSGLSTAHTQGSKEGQLAPVLLLSVAFALLTALQAM